MYFFAKFASKTPFSSFTAVSRYGFAQISAAKKDEATACGSINLIDPSLFFSPSAAHSSFSLSFLSIAAIFFFTL